MREMRRQDRRLDDDGIKEILRIGEYGVLATVTAEGQPYSVPMSYAYDEDSGAIYMHCTADGGQKIDDILSEHHVVAQSPVAGALVLLCIGTGAHEVALEFIEDIFIGLGPFYQGCDDIHGFSDGG